MRTNKETQTIYVSPEDRYIVSFIVGYEQEDDLYSPRDAAHWALELTRDEGSGGTVWFVFDRKEQVMHRFEQREIEDSVA